PGRLYVGTMLAETARGFHADGSERADLVVTWRSSDASVASVDRFGNVSALKPGTVTVSATAEGVSAQQKYTVAANPVASIDLGIKETTVRTGDVVHLVATPKRAIGAPITDAKVSWTYVYTPDDTTKAPGGPAIIDQVPDHGGTTSVFAANAPGHFTLQAQVGSAFARTVLDVKPRDVRQRIALTGRGSIHTTHTSDLWPWTGK